MKPHCVCSNKAFCANMKPRPLATRRQQKEPVHLLQKRWIESLWAKANHLDWYDYACRSSAYIYWDYARYFYMILHERHQMASIGWMESNGIERHPLDGWNQMKSIELIIHLLATKNFGLASCCHILTPSTWHGHLSAIFGIESDKCPSDTTGTMTHSNFQVTGKLQSYGGSKAKSKTPINSKICSCE